MSLPLANPRVAVVAPSHAYAPERLELGLEILRTWGFEPCVFPGALEPSGPYAAPHARRLAQLTRALQEPGWGAVWMARGGSGMTGLLPHLPWGALREVPVIGFSDTTPLLTALHERGLGPAIHGPVVNSLAATQPDDLESLRRLLTQGVPAELPGEMWVEGEVEGPALAGNLCLLAATCGTPFQLRAAGHLLVIEEIAEPAYRVLRLLEQLKQSGVLDGVLGIGLGDFSTCAAPPDAGWTLEDLLREWLAPLGVPVVVGLPVGHGARNRPVRLGQRMRLDATGLRPV